MLQSIKKDIVIKMEVHKFYFQVSVTRVPQSILLQWKVKGRSLSQGFIISLVSVITILRSLLQ